MLTIDYEVEYNNRARVPEHPAIFARWEKDAAAFRDETSQAGRAELGLSYGPSERQFIDLFKPQNDGGRSRSSSMAVIGARCIRARTAISRAD